MSLENDIQHINEGLNEKKRCSSCGEELVNYGGAGLVCTNPECKNTPEEVKNEAKISEKKGFHVGDKVVLVGGYGNQGTVRKVEITFDSVNVWVEWDSVKARGEKWDETYEPNDEDELELVRKPKNEAKIEEGKFKSGIVVKLSNIGGILNQEFFGTDLMKARKFVKEVADAMDPGDIIVMDEGESESTTEAKKVNEMITDIQAKIVNKVNAVIHPNEKEDIIAALNFIINDLNYVPMNKR